MLLDQRLPESHGHAIAARFFLAVILALCAAAAIPGRAQGRIDPERRVAVFEREHPELNTLLAGVERAHGVLYGALARDRGRVREPEVFAQMMRRIDARLPAAPRDPLADAGYAALGARGARVIGRAHAFRREALAILATADKSEWAAALDQAVDRYLADPAALPDVPKDMTILYDHPYTSIVIGLPGAPKKPTARTKGFIWASHWLQLAMAEPLALAGGDERRRDLKVVADRFHRKLSSGKPPNAFPTELPLAPAIAPELVTVHLRTAAILDNLNMMQAVLADVLAHPKATNLRESLDEVIAQFTDRTHRVVDVDDWIRMALRHSIFEQGGPAIGVMTASDRNGSGHFQHLGGARGILPGMK